MRDYVGADRIEGPLLVAEGLERAAYGELVEVSGPTGTRYGQVVQTHEKLAVIELWGDSSGLRPDQTRMRFRGEPMRVAVAEEMLGRIFDGLGRPRDGLPPPLAAERVPLYAAPLNPIARAHPQDAIITGVSVIDGMNTLVRGQKLAIFSGSGLPHDELAAQIALQAQLALGETLAVVFVALGVSHDTAAFFRDRFAASGMLGRTALFLNLADDPPMERVVTPRAALALAEYLAFTRGYHVLALMTDMTNYAETLRELSARRNEVPGRKGYPGYLYTDLASLYERCGILRGRPGSLTQMPVLTMPGDDITHPVPDLTGYITEGQLVLSRALQRQGVYPPLAALPSLSRLMKDGIGADSTRADHPRVAAQLYAAYARAEEVRALAVIVGETALSTAEAAYLEFGNAFEQRFVAQGQAEKRPLADTLAIAWEVLSLLPKSELGRVSEDDIARHYREARRE